MHREKWQQYIDKQDTPEERKATLYRLQQQSPDIWEQTLMEGWEDNAPPMPEAADRRLMNRLTVQLTSQPIRSYRRLLWWSAAASIVVILGSLTFWLQKPIPPEQVAVNDQQLHNTSTTVRLATLPEGSRVWLAPGATLTVPADFNINARRLRLSGEAYFEVAPGQEHPFRVNTGSLQTTVLGTRFNIEAYEGEEQVKVSLSAGKVAVKYNIATNKDSTQLLTPGTRLVYNTAAGTALLEHFQPAAETAWQRGALVLNNVPLTDALRRLELRFHKKISYTPQGKEQKYLTATYEEVPLDVILRNIAFIHGLRYSSKGDSVTIR